MGKAKKAYGPDLPHIEREDTRDPRHIAGQNYIDHVSARYKGAIEDRKAIGEYDKRDVEEMRRSQIMTPEEIEEDFPKELKFGDKGYSRGVIRTDGVVKKAKGGLVTRADGAAKRGKTKGRTI